MILPGSTIGILGGGQLGAMLLAEARRMGYRVHAMDPDAAAPCATRADRFVAAPFSDLGAVLRMAEGCDVVTIETEHVPASVLEELAKHTKVRPGASVLRNINDRLAQRRFLEAHGLPQPRWANVDDAESLAQAVSKVGLPSILKTRQGGYDGKGQLRLRTAADARDAWARQPHPGVLEAFVPFEKEISIVLARGVDGDVAAWPTCENVHRSGILHTTVIPADVPPAIHAKALALARQTIEALGHVGVAAVEMFLVDGELLINEVAPRTHNSGHVTLGAAATSQFGQHLRAICGLPLGDPGLLRPACMVNLLGDLWPSAGSPAWDAILAEPHAHLHLYGKKTARPGRKMGHVLVLGQDGASALRRAEALHRSLEPA
ncbi:MAG TPA: 5-(carboxyamino)imidazole ribonucleotide synthase [Candidatus Thermoplasmatota archaeon]|nr:5-(carboxyamino)imidazole ribonucleotide synthase [Candidatus Thermoplasmatota archaeon]